MMTLGKRQLAAMALACLAAVLGGCSAGQMNVSAGEATLPADEDSAAYLDRLSSQPTVSENDAMRGVLMLVNGQDTAASFEQRVTTLRDQGIVAAAWDFQADRPVTRGRVAFMIYQACKVPGGVMLTLTGPSQRYCLSELQYRGFIAPGAWYNPVSGMEYVAVLGRADAYLETGEVPEVMAAGQQ